MLSHVFPVLLAAAAQWAVAEPVQRELQRSQCRSSDDCIHGGHCNRTLAVAVCSSCDTGYAGDLCEIDIDDCAENPCAPGWNCTDGVNTYSCTCHSGLVNVLGCDTPSEHCNPNPCYNGGLCTSGVSDFSCTCLSGFTGPTCEDNVDDCDPDPCHHGGRCIDLADAFACDCPPGYSGPTCQLGSTESSEGDTELVPMEEMPMKVSLSLAARYELILVERHIELAQDEDQILMRQDVMSDQHLFSGINSALLEASMMWLERADMHNFEATITDFVARKGQWEGTYVGSFTNNFVFKREETDQTNIMEMKERCSGIFDSESGYASMLEAALEEKGFSTVATVEAHVGEKRSFTETDLAILVICFGLLVGTAVLIRPEVERLCKRRADMKRRAIGRKPPKLPESSKHMESKESKEELDASMASSCTDMSSWHYEMECGKTEPGAPEGGRGNWHKEKKAGGMAKGGGGVREAAADQVVEAAVSDLGASSKGSSGTSRCMEGRQSGVWGRKGVGLRRLGSRGGRWGWQVFSIMAQRGSEGIVLENDRSTRTINY
ncbi:unnamed protein product [Chrysoparadoxa australica]